MKRFLFLFMFPVLCIGQYTPIPDSIFEQRLIDLGYDNFHDGQVLTANIINVDSLNLAANSSGFAGAPNNSISDMTGIEAFTGLQYLNCSRNNITSLNLSQNSSLQYLNCSGWYGSFVFSVMGKITSLDLSNNPALTHLICPLNKLTSLDLSHNTSLIELNCANNILSSLDLSQNTNLTHLNCLGYQIQSLDLSQNTNLTHLNCGGNLFTNLDLKHNPFLTSLDCSAFPSGILTGPIMNMNPFNPPPIGKLTSLDLRNGNNVNLVNFDATDNGALHCISVDDSSFSTNNWNNIDYQTIFTNDCSNAQLALPGYTAIPDSVFENKLISFGYDTILDGQVLTSNISNIDSLDISSSYIFNGIYNLMGIEDFTNLTYLECKKNPLITIDLSQNHSLTHLIYEGQVGMGGFFATLTNLILPQNNTLIHLECPINMLSSLDLSQNSSLQHLDCKFNMSIFGGLTNINLSQNPNLTFVDLSASGLNYLNLSQNPILSELYLSSLLAPTGTFGSPCDNNIENLNLTNNSFLSEFSCRGNSMTNLDVRNGNNINFNTFDTRGNGSLYCISVDDSSWSANNWTNIDTHTSFSNNCLLYTLIPDSAFEQRLIDFGYDTVHDGQVLTSNISSIDSLDVSTPPNMFSPPKIYDLTGIESFINLKFLNCAFNELTSLDLSQNILLNNVMCGFNNIQNLNLVQNINLEKLMCSHNPISNIDLSQNLNLKTLNCAYMSINDLDLSQNLNLDTIHCGYNQINHLNLSNNQSLIALFCGYSLLKSLNVRNGNNINFTNFDVTNNDSLFCISVDDSTWSANNWTDIDNHTNFSNDCNLSTVNINEIEKNLSIYPNPTCEEITISIENFNGIFESQLYGITGKLLETTNKTSLSLGNYPRGTYLLKVTYGDRVEQLKVVKD